MLGTFILLRMKIILLSEVKMIYVESMPRSEDLCQHEETVLVKLFLWSHRHVWRVSIRQTGPMTFLLHCWFLSLTVWKWMKLCVYSCVFTKRLWARQKAQRRKKGVTHSKGPIWSQAPIKHILHGMEAQFCQNNKNIHDVKCDVKIPQRNAINTTDKI